jgi:hypothetical protein
MPRNKDLKRLVRARMRKTGEAYTAALSHIKKPATKIASPRTAKSKHADYAALAGTSDETIKAKTGCTWERWVKALDQHGAATMSHREIAAIVSEKYKVPDWWSQAVTVGYERIKGLRARGQRRDGSYEATKSRTFNVPVTTLYDAWADSRSRAKWLTGAAVKLRTATSPKSVRLGFEDGTIVAVGFMSKGAGKSAVAVQHEKLPDRETANRIKAFWSQRLDALGEILTEN